jgi:signal transduction histidine kinase
VTGYRPEEVIGCHFKDFFLSREWRRLDEAFLKLLQGGLTEGEYLMVNKSGEPTWARTSSRPIAKEGRIVGIQGTLTDISQAKIAEQKLAERASELAVLNNLGREMGDDLSVGSAVNTALKYLQQSIDPDVVMLFLRQDHDLILKGFTAKDACHARDSVPIHRVGDCLCGLAVAEAKPVFSTDIHTDPRCTMAECRAAGLQSFAAVPLESGNEIIGILGMASVGDRRFDDQASFLDAFGHTVAIGLKNAILYEKAQKDAHELQTRLTQIQKAEQERESLTAQLQQAQKMEAIGTLAGGIAHDFNNILTPIIMGAELALMSTPVENHTHALLEKVISSGMRAKELVQQILTFSRQSDLERRPLKLVPTLKEALKLARASLPSTIEIQQDIRVQKDLVLANPTQVHQVVMNLITNAAHAMREEGGVLEIALHQEPLDEAALAGLPELSPGHFLRLTVKDTGHGMDRKTVERIFDPFFTTKERGEGTGLGLSIVHGIIRSYDGAIRVESRLGEGTRFEIYLPLIEAAEEVNRAKKQQIPRGSERVLLVDDEPMIVEIHSNMLKALGYQVTPEADPLVALQTFSNNPQGFDLVITDMTMPKLTGDKLASEIMRIRPGMPVILCTGFSERISQELTTDLGIRAFVMKPIGLADIANRIREVLG